MNLASTTKYLGLREIATMGESLSKHIAGSVYNAYRGSSLFQRGGGKAMGNFMERMGGQYAFRAHNSIYTKVLFRGAFNRFNNVPGRQRLARYAMLSAPVVGYGAYRGSRRR
jgi:hypothetical protein